MAELFTRLQMQTDDAKALRRALAKLNLREIAADYKLDGAEVQSLYELRDAVDEAVPA